MERTREPGGFRAIRFTLEALNIPKGLAGVKGVFTFPAAGRKIATMIDLHIHTLASDGQYPASRIVEMAAASGLYAIAIADHNSVESVAEGAAAAAAAGINFAPAIEIDTIFRGRDLHLLGYFIAYDSPACRDYLEMIYAGKIDQTQKRVARLNELGFVLDYDELLRYSEGRLPTGKQYINLMKQDPRNMQNPAFRTFVDGPRSNSPYLNFYLDILRAGKPAFVPLEVQPTIGAMERVKALGGVPVLAHPSDTPEEDVHALIDAGLRGLECYTSYHDPANAARWLRIAQDRGVLVTAGTDYHGPEIKPEVKWAELPGAEDGMFDRLRAAV